MRAVKRIKVAICSLLICDKRAKNNELMGDEGQAECELTLTCPEMKSPDENVMCEEILEY